jgi:hypothetical protein
MSRFSNIAVLVVLAAGALLADPPPAFQQETLKYAVNWPSGLSLGEGELTARRLPGATPEATRWEYGLKLEAALAGFQVADRYRSLTTGGFCTVEFSREARHGARKADEVTTIQPDTGAGRRTTRGGGSSPVTASACVKDALAFLYYTRSELLKGRVPPAQTVLSGAPYQVRLEFRGETRVTVSEEPMMADRVVVSTRGPASAHTFDLYFARDAARTPVLVSLPLPAGVFRLELAK